MLSKQSKALGSCNNAERIYLPVDGIGLDAHSDCNAHCATHNMTKFKKTKQTFHPLVPHAIPIGVRTRTRTSKARRSALCKGLNKNNITPIRIFILSLQGGNLGSGHISSARLHLVTLRPRDEASAGAVVEAISSSWMIVVAVRNLQTGDKPFPRSWGRSPGPGGGMILR